ncbi:MAG: cyclic nucleotide-binding domain-containing protein [Spirochaetaceae bacterium]|jgi:CRP-like cAMP-binding protein|nr:cyclic nucleotide-binding domain-containing protein [Spirochaetaceae bacterium]
MAEKPQLAFVAFKQGAFIIMEGKQEADRFFIIRAGKVKIYKEAEVVKETEGDILGVGDFFGVVSAMSNHGHIETAQAITDVALISVHKNQFEGLIQYNTPIAMKIILQFSRRMRYLDHALTQITLKGKSEEEGSSLLWTIGTFYDRQMKKPQAFYCYHRYIKHCPNGANIAHAQERLKKLAPYSSKVKLEYNTEELNRSYQKDDIIFSEGEMGDELFIIKSGSIKITKYMNNNEVLLAMLKAGDIFGEMALLESKPRSASAIAFEDCQLMLVTRLNFQRMSETQPQIVARLTQLLAERLWFIYKQLSNALIEDPIQRIYDALLMQLEKNRIPITYQQSYECNFSPREFATMVGIPPNDIKALLDQLIQESATKSIQIDSISNNIKIINADYIFKQCMVYRNIRKRAMARKAALENSAISSN